MLGLWTSCSKEKEVDYGPNPYDVPRNFEFDEAAKLLSWSPVVFADVYYVVSSHTGDTVKVISPSVGIPLEDRFVRNVTYTIWAAGGTPTSFTGKATFTFSYTLGGVELTMPKNVRLLGIHSTEQQGQYRVHLQWDPVEQAQAYTVTFQDKKGRWQFKTTKPEVNYTDVVVEPTLNAKSEEVLEFGGVVAVGNQQLRIVDSYPSFMSTIMVSEFLNKEEQMEN